MKTIGKAQLGKLVHKKTATAVALTDVRPEDKSQFDNVLKAYRTVSFIALSLLIHKFGANEIPCRASHERGRANETEYLVDTDFAEKK